MRLSSAIFCTCLLTLNPGYSGQVHLQGTARYYTGESPLEGHPSIQTHFDVYVQSANWLITTSNSPDEAKVVGSGIQYFEAGFNGTLQCNFTKLQPKSKANDGIAILSQYQFPTDNTGSLINYLWYGLASGSYLLADVQSRRGLPPPWPTRTKPYPPPLVPYQASFLPGGTFPKELLFFNNGGSSLPGIGNDYKRAELIVTETVGSTNHLMIPKQFSITGFFPKRIASGEYKLRTNFLFVATVDKWNESDTHPTHLPQPGTNNLVGDWRFRRANPPIDEIQYMYTGVEWPATNNRIPAGEYLKHSQVASLTTTNVTTSARRFLGIFAITAILIATVIAFNYQKQQKQQKQ